MPTTVNYRFQIAGKPAATLASDNPTPLARELVVETDTDKMKRGDGGTAWGSLGYFYPWTKWGRVEGTLSDQTDLAAALSGKQAHDADLDALAALTGTNTIYYRSAANTWSAVTIGGNLGFSGGTLGSALGTMATQAASAVAITGGTITGLSSTGNALAYAGRLIGTNANAGLEVFSVTGVSGAKIVVDASGVNVNQIFASTTRIGTSAGAQIADFTSTGIDVVGLVQCDNLQCDSLRIDATPTSAAVTQTHWVAINLNGTTYKLLLAT